MGDWIPLGWLFHREATYTVISAEPELAIVMAEYPETWV